MNITELAIYKKMFGGGGSSVGPNSIVGTWVFNETLTSAIQVLDTQEKFNSGCIYRPFKFSYVNADGNLVNVESFRCALINGTFDDWTYENSIYVEDEEGFWGYDDGWYNEKYRTIIITEEPSAEVASWLKANAVKQSNQFAYVAPSINELPTDAPTGSMAVVGGDSICGTWYFNEMLTFELFAATVSFVCAGNDYEMIGNTNGSWVSLTSLMGTLFYDDCWEEEEYRTIEILSEPTDATFISWLKENATQTEVKTTVNLFCIRINDEWIYA